MYNVQCAKFQNNTDVHVHVIVCVITYILALKDDSSFILTLSVEQ